MLLFGVFLSEINLFSKKWQKMSFGNLTYFYSCECYIWFFGFRKPDGHCNCKGGVMRGGGDLKMLLSSVILQQWSLGYFLVHCVGAKWKWVKMKTSRKVCNSSSCFELWSIVLMVDFGIFSIYLSLPGVPIIVEGAVCLWFSSLMTSWFTGINTYLVPHIERKQIQSAGRESQNNNNKHLSPSQYFCI